jgi:hypothetical protein
MLQKLLNSTNKWGRYGVFGGRGLFSVWWWVDYDLGFQA